MAYLHASKSRHIHVVYNYMYISCLDPYLVPSYIAVVAEHAVGASVAHRILYC